MEGNLWRAFGTWYLLAIDLLLLIGTIYFLRLKKEQKANSYYWLPFLILSFTVFYENLGAYTNFNGEFKKAANEFFGNYDHPKYNFWVFNICFRQICTILYLFLIKSWIEPSKKFIVKMMIWIFLISVIALQISGLEPIYLNQPIINSFGAYMILIGIALYFMGLISNEQYLSINPVRLISFWQMTFFMFTYTLTHFVSVSTLFIYENYPSFLVPLLEINRVMGILNLFILVMLCASPHYPNLFEKEPSTKFKIKTVLQPNF